MKRVEAPSRCRSTCGAYARTCWGQPSRFCTPLIGVTQPGGGVSRQPRDGGQPLRDHHLSMAGPGAQACPREQRYHPAGLRSPGEYHFGNGVRGVERGCPSCVLLVQGPGHVTVHKIKENVDLRPLDFRRIVGCNGDCCINDVEDHGNSRGDQSLAAQRLSMTPEMKMAQEQGPSGPATRSQPFDGRDVRPWCRA
jgi:hypothetical protein